MLFGHILNELMSEKGITKYRLSKDLDKSPSTITNWIDGKSYPDISTLLQLSQYFGVSTDYLLTGKPYSLPVQGDPVVYGNAAAISDDHVELARLRANLALTERIREVVLEALDNQD
jgi:transcriptional regulator with XRE-family HTH domain